MNADTNKSRLQELMWLRERTQTQIKLQEKLSKILPVESYSFLSFDESDRIQLLQDEWPGREEHLYFQTEVSNKNAVEKIIELYVKLNEDPTIHIFFINYSSCLVSMASQTLTSNWKDLLELDGDDIFISMPSKHHFLCIELVEDVIFGKEQDGRQWIYEIIFSNSKLAGDLLR
jgi:hypothetical protein